MLEKLEGPQCWKKVRISEFKKTKIKIQGRIGEIQDFFFGCKEVLIIFNDEPNVCYFADLAIEEWTLIGK